MLNSSLNVVDVKETFFETPRTTPEKLAIRPTCCRSYRGHQKFKLVLFSGKKWREAVLINEREMDY